MYFFTEAPEELILGICQNMDIKTLCRMVQTNSRIKRICFEIVLDLNKKLVTSRWLKRRLMADVADVDLVLFPDDYVHISMSTYEDNDPFIENWISDRYLPSRSYMSGTNIHKKLIRNALVPIKEGIRIYKVLPSLGYKKCKPFGKFL